MMQRISHSDGTIHCLFGIPLRRQRLVFDNGVNLPLAASNPAASTFPTDWQPLETSWQGDLISIKAIGMY